MRQSNRYGLAELAQLQHDGDIAGVGERMRAAMDELRARTTQELLEASKRVREEPQPSGEDIWRHVFAERNLVAEWVESPGRPRGGNGAA